MHDVIRATGQLNSTNSVILLTSIMAAQSTLMLLTLTVVGSLAIQVEGQKIDPKFDCNSIIVKESEGVLNWLGNVTFIVPVSTTAEGWTAILSFDQKYTGVGVWDLTTVNHPEEMYALLMNKPENAVLTAGDKFSFRFRINYGREAPQPKAVGFKFLDIELCQ